MVKMHSDKREEIDSPPRPATSSRSWASTARRATPTATTPKYCSLENIYVADPVIKMSMQPEEPRQQRTSSARRYSGSARRTPRSTSSPTRRPTRPSSPAWASCTWRSTSNASSASTASRSRSAPRRSATARSGQQPFDFDHKRKKQSGGSGQYGHIVGTMRPMTDEDREKPWKREGKPQASCTSRTRSPAAASRKSTSRRSRRASRR